MTLSMLPQIVFTASEEEIFDDLVDEAEIDAIVEALFPESLTKSGSPPSRRRS